MNSELHEPANVPPEPDSTVLEQDAPRILTQLRRSAASVLSRLPRPVSRAIDLASALSIDRSLAWKIWHVARGEGPFPSPKHIPGRSGFRIFTDAAARTGVDAALVEAARAAFDAFSALGRVHAADRASIDILLGRFTPEGRSRHETALRREMFRGNTHVLGVQARTLFQFAMVYPGEAGYMPEVVLIKGLYGLQRTRADANWLLSQSVLVQATGPKTRYRRSSLATGRDVAEASPLLDEFCTSPLPPVRRSLVNEFTFEDELGPGPIGQAGAVNIVMGERVSHIPLEPIERDAITMRVRTPSEGLCFDLWLHDDIVLPRTPELEFFTLVNDALPYARKDKRDLIPMPEVVSVRGTGDVAPPAPEIPSHTELVQFALRQVGQSAADFRVYRVQLRYPPIPICLTLTYPMKRPG